jgi:hypothetical protein
MEVVRNGSQSFVLNTRCTRMWASDCGMMNRAFSPEILVTESWAVGPGWNEAGLWPSVTTVLKLAKLRVAASRDNVAPPGGGRKFR